MLLALYPLAMGFALVYLGEHYVLDVIAGIGYALAVHWAVSVWEQGRQPEAGDEPRLTATADADGCGDDRPDAGRARGAGRLSRGLIRAVLRGRSGSDTPRDNVATLPRWVLLGRSGSDTPRDNVATLPRSVLPGPPGNGTAAGQRGDFAPPRAAGAARQRHSAGQSGGFASLSVAGFAVNDIAVTRVSGVTTGVYGAVVAL